MRLPTLTPHRLEPGWRYTLAQKFLSLLFGRKWHYISPWKKAGVSVGVLVFCRDKILLGRRGPNVEFPDTWSAPGGFLELAINETMPAAAAREFFEETGLQLNPAQFPATPAFTFMSYHQFKIEEADTIAITGYYPVTVENAADLTAKLTPQSETTSFGWFTEEECRDMLELGKIPRDFTDFHEALKEAFRRLNARETFPPLKY